MWTGCLALSSISKFEDVIFSNTKSVQRVLLSVSNLVRFPNSHGCELGERRVCTRGIFLQWPIVAKIFIESGQLRTELACSTRDLALSH